MGGGGEAMDLDMIQHPPSVSFKLIIRIFVVKSANCTCKAEKC